MTRTVLHTFLSICNIYRCFIPKISIVAGPLSQLLTKDMPGQIFPPTKDMQRSFNLLKRALTEPPVLQHSDERKRLSIETDDSAYQIECSILQAKHHGIRFPKSFRLRTLMPPERNYSATDHEALSKVWSVQLL